MFEEGRDVSDPSVLDAIAGQFDLEYSASDALSSINDDWQEGTRRGVIGSPHFYSDDNAFFCPTLNISRVGSRLQIDFDPDGFATFANSVFGETTLQSLAERRT